nr:uncharacterized protein LOC109147027 [Ipomoea trifida]
MESYFGEGTGSWECDLAKGDKVELNRLCLHYMKEICTFDVDSYDCHGVLAAGHMHVAHLSFCIFSPAFLSHSVDSYGCHGVLAAGHMHVPHLSFRIFSAAFSSHSVWTARNQAVWEGSHSMPRSTAPASPALPPAFNPPHRLAFTGRICFVDAGFHGPNSTAAFGFYLRNGDGSFVVAVKGPLACLHDPALAEAMAVREALSWLKEHDFTLSVPLFESSS